MHARCWSKRFPCRSAPISSLTITLSWGPLSQGACPRSQKSEAMRPDRKPDGTTPKRLHPTDPKSRLAPWTSRPIPENWPLIYSSTYISVTRPSDRYVSVAVTARGTHVPIQGQQCVCRAIFYRRKGGNKNIYICMCSRYKAI